MLLLGIDLGTSSIKVSVVDADTQKVIVSTSYPEKEADIISLHPGWAEQNPEVWWDHTQKAIRKAHATKKYNPKEIIAIGISYQMHGLTVVDQQQKVLRNSIIWCDSRAVEIGEHAFRTLGSEQTLHKHLNSPGNFTASKLAWVKENQPHLYEQVSKILLPGDFLTMKLTGEVSTTVSALSEGVLWDFRNNEVSKDVLQHFGFNDDIIPDIHPVFDVHGVIKSDVADSLELPHHTVVTYKAGDQPNNALSLNVLKDGEVAATAGTSGVIYAVSDQLIYDPLSRVNTFAHVNYLPEHIRTGVLLCINGTGIQNRWIKELVGDGLSYDDLNKLGEQAPAGSKGLKVLPFGNGAERILENKMLNSHLINIDFNRHGRAEVIRASQEGIACAFRYGLDIMRKTGVNTSVIRAGHANLFLSPLFTHAFVNVTGTSVELFDHDGSVGAALAAGVGVGHYSDPGEAVANIKKIKTVEPTEQHIYEEIYQQWEQVLVNSMK